MGELAEALKLPEPSGASKTIRITGLPSNVTDVQVRDLCLPFGPTKSVKVSRKSGSMCQAFVSFEEEDDAIAARDNLAESDLMGFVIHVSFALEEELMVNNRRAVWDDADKYHSNQPRQDE